LADSPVTYTGATADIQGSVFISGIYAASAPYGLVAGTLIVNNTSPSAKTYYYWAGSVTANGYTGIIDRFGGSIWNENQMYAIPIN